MNVEEKEEEIIKIHNGFSLEKRAQERAQKESNSIGARGARKLPSKASLKQKPNAIST
jgi:hypothetical protein